MRKHTMLSWLNKFILVSAIFSVMGFSDSFKKTLSCLSSPIENMQSMDDLISAYGEDIAVEMFQIQNRVIKEELIKCIRKYKNLCALKSLDKLIAEKQSELEMLDIVNSIKHCHKK